MYTEDNMAYNDNYEENNYVESNNNNSIWGLLLRILIIFVCLLLVIWIISKFIGGKKVENDGVVFNNNLDTIRLASEKYFFLEDNLPKEENGSVTISLNSMNVNGMVGTINDYKNKACSTNDNESYATLKKTSIAYELTIKLTCSEEQKEVTYYYDLENGECLSCNGNTYMDGSLVIVDGNVSKEETEENDNTTEDDEYNKEVENLNINCNSWSKWTSIKLTDSQLLVKTRTLYKGYKTTTGGIKTIYGEWSEYSETPVVATDKLEVETKQEIKDVWSENKTTTSYITNSDTIKVITATTTEGSSSCSSYWKKVREEVTASKYQSLNSQGLIIEVHDTRYKTECNENCQTGYTKVYDVTYKKYVKSCNNTPSVTTYTYQELTKQPVTLYRYRTVTQEVEEAETVYTEWVEKLEEGYIKTEEKIEYSYKDTSCKG